MATIIRIPCPQCGAELKLKDPKLLGRNGKCPKCAHRFVLQEPEDEVELELATDDPAETPAVGTAAQWVPDGAPAAAPGAPTFPGSSDNTETAAASPRSAKAAKALKKKRKRKNLLIQIAVGAVSALVIGGGVFALNNATVAPPKEIKPKKNKPEIVVKHKGATKNRDWDAEVNDAKARMLSAAEKSPTKGEKISLKYIPAGARLVIHLRPAELWSDQPNMTEFRFCLGQDLITWVENKLEELTHYKPNDIEEACICLMLISKDIAPEVAVRIRLKEQPKMSDLITKFKGTPEQQSRMKIYKAEKYAYLVDPDDKGRTFAVAPVLMAEEMVEAAGDNYIGTTDGIQALMMETDKDRHISLIFQPADLRLHREYLVGENVQPLLNQFVNWFGDDVETAAWSIHVGQQEPFRPFFSEMLLRNNRNVVQRPALLRRTIRKRLEDLPERVYETILKMNPQQAGQKQLIGRVPAMLWAYNLGTVDALDTNHVQLTTVLHERAGPNLAAGSMLAWAESTRTDFSKDPVTVASAQGPKLPDTVSERLDAKIEIEFKRTPLQEAFTYISEETKVNFIIDGDALKDSGYTKNMAQNHSLGMASAKAGLKAILAQYPEMVIVLDDVNKAALVMTKKFAKNKGLTPFKF